MTTSSAKAWESKRSDETREVESLLREHFEQVDAYRYNSASIRLRVIDAQFEGMSRDKRDKLVEKHIAKQRPETQRDIVTLLTFAQDELRSESEHLTERMLNREFESLSRSGL